MKRDNIETLERKSNAMYKKFPNASSKNTMIYASLSDSTWSSCRCFLRSSLSSLYVLKLSMKNATMIKIPPVIDAMESGSPVRNQSTRATRKMVSSAATDERTGDVREIRTRNEPENAVSTLV